MKCHRNAPADREGGDPTHVALCCEAFPRRDQPCRRGRRHRGAKPRGLVMQPEFHSSPYADTSRPDVGLLRMVSSRGCKHGGQRVRRERCRCRPDVGHEGCTRISGRRLDRCPRIDEPVPRSIFRLHQGAEPRAVARNASGVASRKEATPQVCMTGMRCAVGVFTTREVCARRRTRQ